MVKVPVKTTIYKSEPPTRSYEIGFAPELIEFIIEGEKVKTYRFGKNKDYLQISDVVTIVDSVTRRQICIAEIISKRHTTFRKLPLDELGHEKYSDKEHQRKVFSGYYAFLGREIEDNDVFIVFEFQKL